MTTLTALITSCRIIASDGQSDNFARDENVNDAEFGYAIDGVNRTFVVKNFPVVPGGFARVVADNSVSVAFVPTETTGQLVMTTAPTTSLYVSYYFYLFSDAVWTEFVNAALETVGTTDVTLLPDPLLAAVKSYVNEYFCRRVAQQTGLWYNQKLAERDEARDNISNKWLKLAESSMKKADALLLAFYQGQGAQAGPSFRVGGWQPRTWTPTR